VSVLELMAKNGRVECRPAGETRRTTKCACLGDLLRRDQQRKQTELAISQFCKELRETGNDNKKRREHAKTYRFNPDRDSDCINHPSSKDYKLTVPTHEDGPSTSVVLCRNTMIEMTHLLVPMEMQDAKFIFPSILKQMQQEKRKKELFHLLRYFLALPDGAPTIWEQVIKGTKIVRNTARCYKKDYKLREIASQHMKRVDRHVDWLQTKLQCVVCTIPPDVINRTFPEFLRRGYQERGYKHVGPKSIGGTRETGGYRRVKYLKISTLEHSSSDEKSEEYLKTWLYPIIARALNTPEATCKVLTTSLYSPGFLPQWCHYDYTLDVREKLGSKIYLGLTPLTDSGCYLQVWLPQEYKNRPSHGHVLFIPKGCILLLPSDTIHGGGFLSDSQTKDLRLHFYIYTNGADPDVEQKNIYLSLKDYPHARHLEPGGLIYNLFSQ